jgi:hypothetical protein
MTAATRTTRRDPVAGHVRPEDFRHRGACRSVDVEVFFPTAVAGREHEKQVSIAKAVCAGCRVQAECLTWALGSLPDGIAGGMTEHERRAEQARRRDRRRGRLPRPRVPRRPVGGTRAEIAAAGRAAIAAGLSVREVADEFLVSVRTAARWARAIQPQRPDMAEGSAGGNRAPLLISQQHNPQAGTRTTEGHRS